MSLVSFWFGIIAILWLGYLILEGFDFGVGALLRVVGRDEDERTQVLRTIGPVWDANEVWLLVAGGATFAAFPEWYASMFSGFYLALLLILVGLIVRGVALEYRNKQTDARWRSRWDTAIVLSSALVGLLWGVAFVNIVKGVPLNAEHIYTGNLLTLLNPQALLGGLATLGVFALHGAYFIALRTEGAVRERAHHLATRLWLPTTLVGAVTLLWMCLANSDSSWVAFLGTGLAAVALLVQPALWKARKEATLFGLTTVVILGVVPDRLRLALAERAAVVQRSSWHAHGRRRGIDALHTQGDDLGGRGDDADRARVPGMDLLGVPSAHRSHRARREGGLW